ncbi:hypothetical protein CR513_45205, partial [Mucuna pruriens]
MRSIRERRHFLQEHEDGIGLIKDDPINFCQAMQSSNSQKWIDAMKDELKSMQDNDVWGIVKLLECVKSIGCKWIFKTKKDSKGNIERYKTRLVAKSFIEKEGIDYKETFSLMDIKTAFLNGDIDEMIYMMELENFVSNESMSMILRDYSQGILRLRELYQQSFREIQHEDSKSGDTPIAKGDKFSFKQCPNNDLERNEM